MKWGVRGLDPSLRSKKKTLVANSSVSTEAMPIPNDRERSSHGRRCGPTAAPLGSWGPATVPGRSRPVISSALRAPQGETGQSRRRELGELTRETDGGSRNGIRIHLRVLVDNWIGCKEQLATSSRSTASRGRLIATRGHPQPRPGGCSARREAGVVAGGRPDGQTPASAVPRRRKSARDRVRSLEDARRRTLRASAGKVVRPDAGSRPASVGRQRVFRWKRRPALGSEGAPEPATTKVGSPSRRAQGVAHPGLVPRCNRSSQGKLLR
jgi:hypothetical protein